MDHPCGARNRHALAALLLLAMMLTACGNPPPDPTVSRSDAAAEQLRDRMQTVQAAR